MSASGSQRFNIQLGDSRRESVLSPTLFQYPAMMHASYHSDIIDAIIDEVQVSRMADPFLGAGSSLNEALARGLSFRGQDLNPLGVLISRVQCGPFYIDALERSLDRVVSKIEPAQPDDLPSFKNRDRWFSEGAMSGLAGLRSAVLSEESAWARRFWWVAFAETTRFVSRDRLSTHKLHLDPEKGVDLHAKDIHQTFRRIASRNIEKYRKKKAELKNLEVLNTSAPSADFELRLGDTAADLNWLGSDSGIDLILTSPPYGDNRTTIPYGQATYLPLSLIPLEDLPGAPDHDLIKNTNRLDAKSLGGRRRRNIEDVSLDERLLPILRDHIPEFGSLGKTPKRKVILFCHDLSEALQNCLEVTRSGGVLAITTGRRNVSSREIPMDEITESLLIKYGCEPMGRHSRDIPHKRMPNKNKLGKTIQKEYTLILKNT